MSHLGRPKGVEVSFSLSHIVAIVSDIIGVDVKFAPNCIGTEAEQAVSKLQNGEVLLLENLRFHAEEKAGDKTTKYSCSLLRKIPQNSSLNSSTLLA